MPIIIVYLLLPSEYSTVGSKPVPQGDIDLSVRLEKFLKAVQKIDKNTNEDNEERCEEYIRIANYFNIRLADLNKAIPLQSEYIEKTENCRYKIWEGVRAAGKKANEEKSLSNINIFLEKYDKFVDFYRYRSEYKEIIMQAENYRYDLKEFENTYTILKKGATGFNIETKDFMMAETIRVNYRKLLKTNILLADDNLKYNERMVLRVGKKITDLLDDMDNKFDALEQNWLNRNLDQISLYNQFKSFCEIERERWNATRKGYPRIETMLSELLSILSKIYRTKNSMDIQNQLIEVVALSCEWRIRLETRLIEELQSYNILIPCAQRLYNYSLEQEVEDIFFPEVEI